MRLVDGVIQKLLQRPMFYKDFIAKMKQCKPLENVDVEKMQNLRFLGLPIMKKSDCALSLETIVKPISAQRFCIVDIETNGSKSSENQIIEIGAVMVEDGKEIAIFDSLIHCDILPESISFLTGIRLEDLEFAPPLKSVLADFRLFIKDAVFVAHNVNFDYFFISDSLERAGFGPLLNRRLCTIDLARKTIEAEKYGLGYLMEYFNLSFGQHHRALCDAKATSVIFQKCLENLPKEVQTVEELIYFSKPTPRKKSKNETKQGELNLS
ncbi:MAG: 3'-5' exonuclease [Sulfurospirillaceae bacterium]|nr:3'-5' exonuclease [Sulfurospirillaceae bacterium]